MNKCGCGCDADVKYKFKRGHHSRLRPRKYLPERQREQIRQWAIDNPERVKYASEKHHYMKHYGLTVEEAMAIKAKGCSICPADGTDDRGIIVIDHDHETGVVRGALCEKCNRGIGHLKDDIDILFNAIKYLRQHRNKP